jgi:hypothetical protein
LPINRQSPAGRHPANQGSLHEEGSAAMKLFFQESDGILQGLATQGIGADQLRQGFKFMGRGKLCRFHLTKHHGNPAPGSLPRCFAAGQAAADDGDMFRLLTHNQELSSLKLFIFFG